ncbi:cell division protein FtsQ [Hephaestia caeni]|uniref:Cell division protein FtsQ n=1 Tax=Hephaestia caeni TaxID=645617 RepID=A0A397PIS1_9SPHN|nr:cell division protein FtsQ [Hephaestia caeni]
MSRTIRRGSPPRRGGAKRRVQKPPRRSFGDRILEWLQISEETLRRTVTWAIVLAASAVLIVAATWIGVPGMVGAAIAEGVGRAGFRVEQVEVTGLKRMDKMTVYAVALDQQSRAMPLVDLEDVRQKLLRYGWIEDAHVSRRLPDTLLIQIDERTPAAVWQDNGQLTLIDANGVLLEPVSPAAMPPLPLLIGEGAAGQAPAYQALIDAAPALRPRIRAATWIGNRRWNLLFDSGETLALPEEDAARALVKFAELDGADRLLGKGFLRFDMRDPTKLVARKPGEVVRHDVAPAASPRPIASDAPVGGEDG